MIRLRKITGETNVLPSEFKFVELCSEDGLVAAVVWQDDIGMIHMARDGDRELQRYSALFRVPMCPTIDLNQKH